MLLITLQSCEAGQSAAQGMWMLQPLLGQAALLIFAGVVLLAQQQRLRKLTGQALLSAGLLLGTVPALNRLPAALIDCTQPEQVARLAAGLPVANGLALLWLACGLIGIMLPLWRLMDGTDRA